MGIYRFSSHGIQASSFWFSFYYIGYAPIRTVYHTLAIGNLKNLCRLWQYVRLVVLNFTRIISLKEYKPMKFRKELSLASKVFLAILLFPSFFSMYSKGISAFLQLIFVGIIIIAWNKKISVFRLIPNEIIVSIPYFWAINLILITKQWKPFYIVPFLIIFAFALLDTFRLPNVFQSRWDGKNLKHGLWWTISFYFLMASALRNVFPPFTHELFLSSILQGILFLGGIPICISAFHEYFHVPTEQGT